VGVVKRRFSLFTKCQDADQVVALRAVKLSHVCHVCQISTSCSVMLPDTWWRRGQQPGTRVIPPILSTVNNPEHVSFCFWERFSMTRPLFADLLCTRLCDVRAQQPTGTPVRRQPK
jgi:hypothetical protein